MLSKEIKNEYYTSGSLNVEYYLSKVEQLEQQNKGLIEENKKLKENKLCVSCFNYKFCAPTKIYKSFEILENQINDK